MSAPGWSIEAADLERDRDAILDLWKRALPNLTERRWDWIYRRNPAGSASVWLARGTEKDPPAGAAALFPRTFFRLGAPVRGAVTGDFGVDASARGMGPALALQRRVAGECGAHGFQVLYGFPNPSAEAVQRRVGFRLLGRAVRRTRILHWGSAALRSGAAPGLLRPARRAVDSLVWAFSREAWSRLGPGLVAETPPAFDERFDRLFERAAGAYGALGERTSRFLSWRFLEAPHEQYEIFALSHASGARELAGYVVSYGPPHDVRIADLLAEDTRGALDALLGAFLRHRWRAGTERLSIAYLGRPDVSLALSRHGFVPREDSRPVLLRLAAGLEEDPALASPDDWHLLECDADL